MSDPEIDSVTWTNFGNNMAPPTFITKELICFKRVVELRSRPQVEVLPDIRLGSKADQNSLAT